MSSAGIPPGWYPDPSNASQQRYWDGTAWTDATAPGAPGYGYGAPGYGVPGYGGTTPGYGGPGYGTPTYGAAGYGTTQVGYGYAQAIGAPLAGFWARFGAYLVDQIILGIPSWIISAVFLGTSSQNVFDTVGPVGFTGGAVALQIVLFIADIAYYAYFEGTGGQTPGKKLLGIRVVDADSLQPGVGIGRGIGRFFARWLSGIVCYLGYLWMLWDPQKQTWHDKMCRTKVVKDLQ